MIIIQSAVDSLKHVNDSLRGVISSFPQNRGADNIEVYLAILVAISTGITIVFNWVSQRVGFKDEYYKSIIRKRLNAIEAVETFLLNFQTYNDIQKDKLYFKFFKTIIDFDKFHKEFIAMADMRLWLSNETIKHFEDFNKAIEFKIIPLFYPILEKEVNVIPFDRDIIELGFIVHNDCALFSNNLKSTLLKEMTDLHKVKKFLKSKK